MLRSSLALRSVTAALALLLGATSTASAQSSGPLGTDFWACDLENADLGDDADFGLIVANPGTGDATVRVMGSTGELATEVVPADGLHVFRFDRSRMMRGTQQAPNAYHVISSAPVTVQQVNPLSETNTHTNDVSTLLPVGSLGTAYRPVSREGFLESVDGDDLPGIVAIVGVTVEPATVTIVPNGDVRAGTIAAVAAGVPIVVTLNQFDVLQLVTERSSSADLTGSLITSNRPVAVFGGARCSFVPSTMVAAEHLEEQSLPLAAWGREYLLVKAFPRESEPDAWRFVAAEDDTRVTLTPPVVASFVLRAGGHLEVMTSLDLHAVADKPISVGHFFVGSGPAPSIGLGDPSLSLPVPIEQFAEGHAIIVPPTQDQDFVTIISPAGTAVTLDGAPVVAAEFEPIGATGFERARLRVIDGLHRIDARAGVSVQAYGYSSYSAFSTYGSGLVRPINTPITCDVGGPYVLGCERSVMLDGSTTTGPPPLEHRWSAITPGVAFATPDANATLATFSGTGPWTVSLTVTSGTDASTCYVTIADDGDVTGPVIACAPLVTAVPTAPSSAFVAVTASATDACGPAPPLVNDRTAGGANADDTYPCGQTLVTFTATDLSGNTANCVTRVVVMDASIPAEVSGRGSGGRWLRVAKDPNDPSILRITFERPSSPLMLVNLYAGTILPGGIVAYDHVPLECAVAPVPVPPDMALLTPPFDAGTSHYYLVSSSNCLGESTRGFRSDGIERPSLATDCGALR